MLEGNGLQSRPVFFFIYCTEVKMAITMLQLSRSISCQTRQIVKVRHIIHFLCFSLPLSLQGHRRGEQRHRGGDEDRQG